ncbi:MAG: hypothetical protein N2171_01115 [Clostridia bacterium]|nr:hypothetical protein [Clostridia bacterium]
MKHKKLIFAASFFAIILCISIALYSTQHKDIKTETLPNKNAVVFYTDWYTCPDSNDLIDSSDLVIVGSVVDVNKNGKSEVSYSIRDDYEGKESFKKELKDYEPSTISRVKVEEIIKGSSNVNDTIQIALLGGIDNGIEYIDNSTNYFKKGDRCIFFLIKRKDDKYIQNAYNLVNPYQGYILLDGKKAKLDKQNDLFKSGLTEENIKKEVREKIENLKQDAENKNE